MSIHFFSACQIPLFYALVLADEELHLCNLQGQKMGQFLLKTIKFMSSLCLKNICCKESVTHGWDISSYNWGQVRESCLTLLTLTFTSVSYADGLISVVDLTVKNFSEMILPNVNCKLPIPIVQSVIQIEFFIHVRMVWANCQSSA